MIKIKNTPKILINSAGIVKNFSSSPEVLCLYFPKTYLKICCISIETIMAVEICITSLMLTGKSRIRLYSELELIRGIMILLLVLKRTFKFIALSRSLVGARIHTPNIKIAR